MHLPRFPHSQRAGGQPCRGEPKHPQLAHFAVAADDSDPGHCGWHLWSSAEQSRDREGHAEGRGESREREREREKEREKLVNWWSFKY